MIMIYGFKESMMKLTIKDKEFLEKLKNLFENRELSVELNDDGIKRMVLRKNYGDKIESRFGLTRQGVRWRFHRLFSKIYTDAYLTIFWIESNFGTELRELAIEIAKERVALRKKAKKMVQNDVCRR